MKYAIFVLLGLSAFACFAQDSAEYRACTDKANTQGEMTSCASAEANRVDAKLNSTYRALLAKVASQPEAVAKIKAAERAWVAYRDAYIEASYPMPLLSVVPELDATAFAADCRYSRSTGRRKELQREQ